MENILVVNDLKKKFKNGRGVESVSFVIQKGDIFGLLGANGAGKTTTMKVLTGLMEADGGDVNVFGKSLSENFEEIMEDVGALIETPAFYSYLTAEQNMKLAAKYYSKKSIDLSQINTILEEVKLLRYKKDRTGKFSLGMKQRMGLALAMINSPKLLILDEPSNGLDIEGIIEIRNIILNLARSGEASFLISSHQSAEIEKTCNKVGVIYDGMLKETAVVEDVLQNYPSLEDYYLKCVSGKTKGALA